MKDIKYTVLIDYILETLRRVRLQRPDLYASLVSIMKIFKYPISFGEIQELGRYLETKGWAKVIFPLGDVRLQITTRGLLYIEEKGEEFKKGFKAYREEIINEYPDEERLIKLFSEEADTKKNIFKLLDIIVEKVRKKDGENDIIKDIEVIKIELTKNNPDLKLIEIKLSNLSSLSYLSSEIQQLKDFLIPF